MQERDYQKYDYIEIIVKKENTEQVINDYHDFLWQEISIKEDAKYSDILHVEFCRAHDIANKDRLQLLQVYYEFALNERANSFEKKHHKSNAGIFNLAFFATVILVGLWWLIFYIRTLPIFIGGILLTAIVVFFIVFFATKLKKFYNLESERFKIFDLERQKRIDTILAEARLLTLSNDGGEVC